MSSLPLFRGFFDLPDLKLFDILMFFVWPFVVLAIWAKGRAIANHMRNNAFYIVNLTLALTCYALVASIIMSLVGIEIVPVWFWARAMLIAALCGTNFVIAKLFAPQEIRAKLSLK